VHHRCGKTSAGYHHDYADDSPEGAGSDRHYDNAGEHDDPFVRQLLISPQAI